MFILSGNDVSESTQRDLIIVAVHNDLGMFRVELLIYRHWFAERRLERIRIMIFKYSTKKGPVLIQRFARFAVLKKVVGLCRDRRVTRSTVVVQYGEISQIGVKHDQEKSIPLLYH